jgi:hypothetical protein
MIQTMIFLLSCPAFFLVGCEAPELRLIGFWCGLLSEPFWIYETARKKQIGMFMLSIIYGGIWILNVVKHS